MDVDVTAAADLPVKRIEVLRLEPGDILVFTLQEHVSEDRFRVIRERVTEQLPEGVRALFADRIELSVVRPPADA